MASIVCRYAVLISQEVYLDEAAFRKRCLWRCAAEQVEQKFSYLRHRSWVNIEVTGAVLRWLVPQRDCAHGFGHAAIVSAAARGIFLNHRDKEVVAAEFTNKAPIMVRPGPSPTVS